MAVETRKRLHMWLFVPLVMCATVNGFLLGHVYETGAVIGVLTLTALMVALTLGAEHSIAATEEEAKALSARLAERTADLDAYKEKVRQLDRIVAMISDQNDDLRQRLQSGKETERSFVIRKSEGNVSFLRDWRKIPKTSDGLDPTGSQGS